MHMLTSVELCAGAGGQALGLEQAGFLHRHLVDIDKHCVETLRLNRPGWDVSERDLKDVIGDEFRGVDLLAGGLPCPPFSVAGKQLGPGDERNLFNDALRIIENAQPKMVLIENVRGFLDPRFADYRNHLKARFNELGYAIDWRLINASSFGVPQLRPRVAIVAGKHEYFRRFSFPSVSEKSPKTVGETLIDLMAAGGWELAKEWAAKACEIAPTVVGGSKKHGGPDLGPTRARLAWEKLGVDGKVIADNAPAPGFRGLPRLTPRMVARLQGFPDSWMFSGRKTQAYKQVGNAFPPPVAKALGLAIASAIFAAETADQSQSEMAAE